MARFKRTCCIERLVLVLTQGKTENSEHEVFIELRWTFWNKIHYMWTIVDYTNVQMDKGWTQRNSYNYGQIGQNVVCVNQSKIIDTKEDLSCTKHDTKENKN